MRKVNLDNFRKVSVGYAGENLAVDVEFDVTGWNELYGDGTFILLNRRPGEAYAYPVSITRDENTVKWHVTATDTEYEGIGECELVYTVNNIIAKSVVYNTVVSHALGNEEDPPEPWVPWIEVFTQLKTDAETAKTDAESARDLAQTYASNAEDSAMDSANSALSASQSAQEATEKVEQIENLTAQAQTLPSGSQATANYNIDTGVLTLGIPQGEQGIQGETGAQGPRGPQGETGNGIQSVVKTGTVGKVDTYTITFTDGTTTTFEVTNGEVTNEVLYSFLPTDTAQGEIASFSDGANDVPVEDLLVDINPVQDLNGQSSPYPAGGGKNKFSGAWPPDILNASYASWHTPWTDKINVSVIDKNNGADISGVYFGLSDDGTGTPIRWLILNGNVELTHLYYAKEFVDAGVKQYAIMYPNTEETLNRLLNRFLISIYTESDAEDAVQPYAPYSNICPISGWTGAVVQRTGVNVWDEEWILGFYNANGVFRPNTDGYMSSKNAISVLPNTSYCMTIQGIDRQTVYVCWYDADMNFIERQAESTQSGSKVFTSPSNATYMQFSTEAFYGATYNHDISINYPSTDTSYHAYQGQTHSISWATEAGTVYGGTLDVTTGLLTVDMAMVTLDGTQTTFPNWRETETSIGWLYYTTLVDVFDTITDQEDISDLVSSSYLPTITYQRAYGGSDDNGISIVPSTTAWSLAVRMSKTLVPDSASVNTYLASNPLTVVCKLATPQTYQLTPTEVRTLLGDNNIWVDTGDTEVTYRADIQKYIDKQISAVLNA